MMKINKSTLAKNIAIGLIFASSLSHGSFEMHTRVSGLESKKEDPGPPFEFQRFNNCGQSGRFGPSMAQCSNTLTNIEELIENFGFNVENGYQYWTVPSTGIYQIKAAGATGGSGEKSGHNGRGIIVQSEFSLKKGERIIIAVGQRGKNNIHEWSRSGGGGGGTFLAKGNNISTAMPLLVAGGGAGGVARGGSNNIIYPADGRLGNDGDISRNVGNSPGNGASFSEEGLARGGDNAGSFRSGLAGGLSTCYGDSPGGFGGGGSPYCTSGAGGGGYTGGSGTQPDSSRGEGGGSFSAGQNTISLGLNHLDGYVEIRLLD